MKKSMTEVAEEIAYDMLDCGIISKAQYAAYLIMLIREKNQKKTKKNQKQNN